MAPISPATATAAPPRAGLPPCGRSMSGMGAVSSAVPSTGWRHGHPGSRWRSGWACCSPHTGAGRSSIWTPRHRSLFGDLWFYPIVTVAAWSAWRASVRCAPSRRLRVGWRLIAFALVESLLAEVAQTAYESAGQKPYPSIADVMYLLFYVVLLAGVLQLGIRRRGHRPAGATRASISRSSRSAARSRVWYVVLGPTAMPRAQACCRPLFSIAYPVGDMVLLGPRVGAAA